MAEHFVVLLVALLCLVTTSSCEDSFDTCREASGFPPDPPRLKTKQGTTIKPISVLCDLSRQKTVGKSFHTYDITRVVSNFVAAEVDNASLVMVNLFVRCKSPIEVRFNNSRHIVYNNILLSFGFSQCTITSQTLLGLANATDFRRFDVFSALFPSLWLEERRETAKIATGLKEIAYATLSTYDIEELTGVLNNTHKVLSNLAKLTVQLPICFGWPINVKQISTDEWRLTMPNLQYLDLSWNRLTKPPQFPWNNSTLKIFRELRRIERYENFDVPKNLYIRGLDLSSNNIEDLSSYEFRGFLHKLVLQGNGLKWIGPTCFRGLQRIQSIDLSHNELSYLPSTLFHGLTSLIHIDLSYNQIGWFFRYREALLRGLINIKRISLNNNAIDYIPDGLFYSLNKLAVLRLDSNYIKTIGQNPFSPYSSLQQLHLQNNRLTSFPSWIFHLKKIKNIDLSNNQITRLDLNWTGQGVPDVRQFLNASEISYGPVMPQDGIELNLIKNDITDILPHHYLKRVTVLKLTNNKVFELQDALLKSLKHVKTLLIDWNELTSLPEEIKQLNFTKMALSKNRFKCDCSTKWMTHWLLKNKERIIDYDKVLCSLGQPDLRGKQMYNLTNNMFICSTGTPHHSTNNSPPTSPVAGETSSPYLTIAITVFSVVCGLLLLIIIIGILLYKYKGEVKVFMFTRFNWHPFDRLDDSDPDKIYDAFISYNGEDFKWVVNTLQKRLENHNPPYRLCLHHRDFRVGALIQENIFNSVDHSKRMIMVLSSNFAKSEWCLLEFRFAHQKVLQDRTNYLIIIMFDDVDMAELDEEIKLYMRTNTYLRVSDEWFWQKLFYAMPVCSAKESVEESVTDGQSTVASETMPLTE